MNTEYFIAKRFGQRDATKQTLSYLIIRLTVIAIALSVATMIISVAIGVGFRKEIEDKLSNFVGHILITKETSNQSFELNPIPLDSSVIAKIKSVPAVEHVQVFAIKPGLIKHKNNIQGVVLKGVWRDFNWKYFDQYLIKGGQVKLPENKRSKQIIISSELARLMDYKLGHKAFMFFVQNPPRLRQFKISGIYETGLTDFDKIYILTDIRQIQKLNGWTDSAGFLISGYEVFVKNFKDIDRVEQELKEKVAFGFEKGKPKLKVQSIKELYPDMFSWLTLVNMNVVVILAIMLVIALINMTSGVLIIILEKASFIGILKALGATNKSIKKIWVYNSWFMLKKGLFYGNLIALAFIFAQMYFHIIPLDPKIYFVKYVPVAFNFVQWILINVATIFVTLIFMILPATIATRVDPIKAIRFE